MTSTYVELHSLIAKLVLTLQHADLPTDPDCGQFDPRPELEQEARRLGVNLNWHTLIYRLHPAAQGRPMRWVYAQAQGLDLDSFEVKYEGAQTGFNVIAGDHDVWRGTGYNLKMHEARGSVLPAKDGRWVVATHDPRSCMNGPAKFGFKNMTDLKPLTKVDIYRAKNADPDVPRVSIRTSAEVLAEWRKSPGKWLSVDIEGTARDPHLLGVGWGADQAWVIPWDKGCFDLMNTLFRSAATPIFHNANYDVAELWELGIEPPSDYVDTMTLGHVYNPSLKKGLQTQVLSWVEGTTAWKGLVDHKHGYTYCPAKSKVAEYRRLWSDIILRLGRKVPKTDHQWYCFYNGLDVAYTWRLNNSLRSLLEQQGDRLKRYDTIERRLQPHLVAMGFRGMPVNPQTRDELVRACRKAERDAYASIGDLGREILKAEVEKWEEISFSLKRELQAAGAKLTGNKEYTSARNKLRTRQKNLEKGFNLDAPAQRAALIYDHLGLPTVGREGRSTQAAVLETLDQRLEQGKIGPISGTVEDARRIINALIIGKANATWRRNFLSSKLTDTPKGWPRMKTEYHLHRAATGRLSSGSNTDDDDKSAKKQQLQNVPEPLRAPVEADPGHVLVGGDWSNVEWAVLQVYQTWVPNWVKDKYDIPHDFHQRLLDRFLSGDLDAHRYLASIAERKPEPEITKGERKNCKSYTHGRNYFGHERALAAAAGHTIQEAKRVCEAHEEAFKLRAFWEWYKEFVAKHGYVETPAEWRRWFFDDDPKPTEIFGTVVQAGAADLCKYVLIDVFESLPTLQTIRSWDQGKPAAPWEVLTTTHDSIVLMVPLPDEQLAVDWLKRKMEQPIPFLDNICFPADVGSGPTWKDV
jgi:DNA polymerase I-like protein with 3'-5' exonuclease and polymerase domains